MPPSPLRSSPGLVRSARSRAHHADIDVRLDVVHLALSSQDVGGVTARDVALGRAIDAVVAELGLVSEPTSLTQVEIAIDALDIDAVRPFWAAVLGYDVESRDDVQDGLRLGPAVWFQQMDEPRPQRNRIHLDVTVAHDEASARIERALAAGGHLVSDAALRPSGSSPTSRATRPACAHGRVANPSGDVGAWSGSGCRSGQPFTSAAASSSRSATSSGCVKRLLCEPGSSEVRVTRAALAEVVNVSSQSMGA